MKRWIFLLLVCACGGREPPESSRDAAAITDAAPADAGEADAGGGPIASAPCPAATLDAFPLAAIGDSTGAQSEFEASCAGAGGSPDVAIVWTAPSAARYRISTAGSAYDTVLTLLDGTCGGAELACQDDIDGTTLQSEIEISLASGQTVTIVVDGLDPQEQGAFQLSIDYD